MAAFLPPHLRKYVVTQNYEKYTPVDQAVWRYILRQLRSFLSTHAHECYLDGLTKTGIDVERIPRIEDISEKLQKFGWRAVPVSGFIPPAAFMELQSLSVLPIASDMRTMDHLLYTPAPDIVHEAAGHAPILIHPEFTAYLREYAQVAKKAIISKEDLDMYEAIRDLSDIKENPTSTPEQILAAEKHLEKVSKSISHISEAAELGRMNWWTAEYGLIGDLQNPKIFGAGLLSSAGESKWCLSPQVKKIPLTVDCIKQGYDITEPQPQLFVTPDFKTLVSVLDEMAQQMAYRTGGVKGMDKAIQAQSVNTLQLNSGLQISGVISERLLDNNQQIIFYKLSGPVQICYQDKQLDGHHKEYHSHGFSSPLGALSQFPNICPTLLTQKQLASIGIQVGHEVQLQYCSGFEVRGFCKNILRKDGKNLILTIENAHAQMNKQVYFEPAWGSFDIALGQQITSVFGGPADRNAFGETDDFVAKRVPQIKFSEIETRIHQQYQNMRNIREKNMPTAEVENLLTQLLSWHDQNQKTDWLLRIEAYEIALKNNLTHLQQKLLGDLEQISRQDTQKAQLITDGLKLAGQWS